MLRKLDANSPAQNFHELLSTLVSKKNPTPEEIAMAKKVITFILSELSRHREHEIFLYQKFIQQNPTVQLIPPNKMSLDLLIGSTSFNLDPQIAYMTLLTRAAGFGHPDFLNLLVKSKADLHVIDGYQDSALTRAIFDDRLDNLQELLNLKANPELVANANGHTPLTKAAAHGRVEMTRVLLDAKANVNARNTQSETETPLTQVAKLENEANGLEITRMLLERKANIDMQTKSGNTPLSEAVSTRHYKIARELLTSKANPNLPEPANDKNPLTYVISEYKSHYYYSDRRQDYVNMIQALLEAKADINTTNKYTGDTFLMDASTADPLYTNYSKDIVKLFLENKADPNITNKTSNDTPFLAAARSGNIDVMKVMMDCKVDVNAPYAMRGESALIHFLQGRKEKNYYRDGFNYQVPSYEISVKSVRILLEAKADPNAPNSPNLQTVTTPLLQSISLYYRDVATALLDAKADVTNQFGQAALVEAIEKLNDSQMVRQLLDAKADPNPLAATTNTPLIAAAEKNNTEMIKMLLEAKARPNVANETSGQTPLLASTGIGNVSITKMLLAAKALPNTPNPRSNQTPLISAASSGSSKLVQVLLDAGASADIDKHNVQGQTALTVAAAQNPEVLQTLLNAEAEINIRNTVTDGCALTIAAFQGKTDIVKQLLEANADVETVENKKTAMDIAVEQQRFATVSLLFSRKAVLHDPNAFYLLLIQQDFNDFVVLNLFLQFYQQQVQLLGDNAQGKLNEQLFSQLLDNHGLISKALEYTSVSDGLFDEATCENFSPRPIRDLIRSYDFSFERMGLFGTKATLKEVKSFVETHPLKKLERRLDELHEELRKQKKQLQYTNLFSTSHEPVLNEIYEIMDQVNTIKRKGQPSRLV